MLNRDLINKTRKVIMVVAHDSQYAIGKDGGLIVKDKADLRWFKLLTTGHACIVGRTTYNEVCDLPNRTWVCITRNKHIYQDPNMITVESLDTAISTACELAQLYDRGRDIILAGGAQIYDLALDTDSVDEIWATVHPYDAGGTTFIKPYDLDGRFVLVEEYPLNDNDATYTTDRKTVSVVRHYIRKRI